MMKISAKIKINKNIILKSLVLLLKILVFILLAYIICAPFYPQLKYYFFFKDRLNRETIIQQITPTDKQTHNLPENLFSVSQDRLLIPEIGINAPIITSDNEKYALSRGAWLVPMGSTPDKGGNTIITGHRFKYLPPNNTTFYLFDKLKVGDEFSVLWQGSGYRYRVKEIKIIDPSDPSPYNKSEAPILTMYTCTPIYSTKERLLVISELIGIDENIKK